MSQSKPVRCVIYVRLSVTTETSVSIERQLKACRKYADARGWTVVGEFTDDGVSATKNKPHEREGWRALIESTESYDVVLSWKLDRLCRRVIDFMTIHETLDARGAAAVCVEDAIDMTTATGRAVAVVLAAFAQLEAETISTRVKDARAEMISQGRRPAGLPPYGWMHVKNPTGNGWVLAQDPERIRFVEGAAALALDGKSVYRIAQWMTAQGAPKRQHKLTRNDEWSEYSVGTLLRNPVLAGMVAHKGGVLLSEDGTPVIREGVGILSLSDYQTLVGLLDSRKSGKPRDVAQTLLSGIIRCATCDYPMSRYRNSQRAYYRCANPAGCPDRYKAVNRDKAESHVVEQLLSVRGDEPIITVEVSKDPHALAERLAALDVLRDQLAEDFRKPGADRSALVARMDAADDEYRRLSAGITKAEPTFTGQTVRQAWTAAGDDVDAQRTVLLGQLWEKGITVKPGGRGHSGSMADRIEIDWTPDDRFPAMQ